MESLRKPFLLLALALSVIIVLIEIGGLALPHGPQPVNCAELPPETILDCLNHSAAVSSLAQTDSPPGMGSPYMALLDGVVLFTMILTALPLLVPQSIQGRLQGCASCIFTLLLLLAAIAMIFVALTLVLLMIALLLAIPFGTIFYFAVYGSFNRGGAAAVLSLIMLLKLGFAGSLVAAQQRFLRNTGLVLLVLTSLLANIIISFLHGFVPGFLVSITDGIGAIIVAILAVIWLLFLGIGSIFAVIKALQPS
jgi:hypothetical protein